MGKIYFNNNGWVCQRYPYNLPVENENSFIEADEQKFNETFASPIHFAWRVRNGMLVNERYEETPTEEVLQELRLRREQECFSVINRGHLWHDMLSLEQKQELMQWYHAWLNVTETRQIPRTPTWLDKSANCQAKVVSVSWI